MRSKQAIQIGLGVLVLAALVAILGCPSPNTPGSDNSTNTDTILRVSELVGNDSGSSAKNQVDMLASDTVDNCGCPASGGYFDVQMSVFVKNESISGEATTVTLTDYKVVFSGPVALPAVKAAISYTIPAGNTINLTGILMMPVSTKFIYRDAHGGQYAFDCSQILYKATVTFNGVNDFGEKVTGEGSVYLELADWCT